MSASGTLPNLDHIPPPSDNRLALHVTPAAERALRRGHPWLFADNITQQNHEGSAGDLAIVFDKKRRFLAIGLYDPQSPIRVKILHQGKPATIDSTFLAERVKAAIALRQPIAETDTTGYRLIHGENDGLPSLILDRYGDTLVLKLYSAIWFPYLADLLPVILDAQPCERMVLRLSRNLQQEATFGLRDGQALIGDLPDAPVIFREYGLQFAADVVHGHKTGFFFDHRENRKRVQDIAARHSVLDVFAYAGPFSVHAAAGGARSVTSIDVSAPALEAAKANMARNPKAAQVPHEIIMADAFDALHDLAQQGRQFSMVIVDPPSFAKSQAEIEGALRAYANLTRLALAVLAPAGVLVMASCSSRVSTDDFYSTVHRAANDIGRPLQEIERTGHALDHPIGFPEGAYLKCLFAQA
ncbi:MAG: class I SAM-dependent methyltransferase [Anaerolineaceae bacterium]|nr:class I SAM-dependent methyltransferase [Anaerolineaceae bacterium]